MNLFLSIGAMKAGTTWLYSLLDRHPDLYFTPEKEIHFLNRHYVNPHVLSDDFRLNQAKNRLKPEGTQHLGVYKGLARWYAMYLEQPDSFQYYTRLFSLNKEKPYSCDFSNLSCHLTAKNWRDLQSQNLFEDIRVIYILRDPIQRLWSHTKFHHQYAGKSTDFSTWSAYDFRGFLRNKFIWENATYHQHIQSLADAFTPEQYKILYFEDFKRSPRVALETIEDFLGISSFNYSEERLNQKVNPSKSIPMPASFSEAAEELVKPEIEKLQGAGFSLHDSWQIPG